MSATQIKAEDLRVGDTILGCMTADEWTVHPVDPPFKVQRVEAVFPMVYAYDGTPNRRLDIQGATPVYVSPQSGEDRPTWQAWAEGQR